MKFNFIFLLVLLGVTPTWSQKVLTEGIIKMEVSDVQAEDPQMAAQLEMMKGTTMEVAFKGNNHVSNVNMMGGLAIIRSQILESEKKMNLLMDMMGQKFWIESNLEEAVSAEQKELAQKSVITYDENDKKEIMGYSCYKMTITNPDMGMDVSGYVTNAIKSKANLIRGFETLEYKGFPMEFTVKNNMFSMTTTTIAVEDKVDDSKLQIDTTGYKKMTMQEFQESFGGMGF